MKTKIGGVRTWIEVDTKALKNNYESFRKLLGGRCKLMAIVKSNAYGHSLVDYSKEMEGLGCDFLGVDSITEAIALRREGIKIPILVLGYTLPELHSQAVGNSISLTISTVDSLKEITQFSQKFPDLEIKIHIKIDSGMHRQGFCLEEIDSVIKDLKSKDNIKIEGVYTHFAAAKNPAFPADTKKQILEFNKGFNLFKEEGLNPIKHAAATSGSIVFPDSHFDMVRIGIGLYGLWPSLEVKSCFGKDCCKNHINDKSEFPVDR
jgi:alanine racemase